MYAEKVELSQGEEVLFDRANALLTSERLMLNWHKPAGDKPADVLLVRDVDGVRKIVGGQERRVKPALQLIGGGIALGVTEYLVDRYANAPGIADVILFLGAAVGILAGVYLLIGALLGLKPRTTLLFVVFGGKDVGVAFPGHDNPDAEELARLFRRLKSDL